MLHGSCFMVHSATKSTLQPLKINVRPYGEKGWIFVKGVLQRKKKRGHQTIAPSLKLTVRPLKMMLSKFGISEIPPHFQGRKTCYSSFPVSRFSRGKFMAAICYWLDSFPTWMRSKKSIVTQSMWPGGGCFFSF